MMASGVLLAVALAVTNHAGYVVSGELTAVTNGRFTISGRSYPLTILPPAEQLRVKAAAGCDVRTAFEKRVAADLAQELKWVEVRLAKGVITEEEARQLRLQHRTVAALRLRQANKAR